MDAYSEVQGGVFGSCDQVSAQEHSVALLTHAAELGVADRQHMVAGVLSISVSGGQHDLEHMAGQ